MFALNRDKVRVQEFLIYIFIFLIHTFQVDLVKQSGRKWADDAEVTNCIACQSGTLDAKFLAITFSYCIMIYVLKYYFSVF